MLIINILLMAKVQIHPYLKVVSIFLIGFGLGLMLAYFSFPPFYQLSSEEMRLRIISERDYAIKKVIGEGKYNCCVSPVCTMCYLEGNLWNHQKPGECDCVSFIQKGEAPCPQCLRALNRNNN